MTEPIKVFYFIFEMLNAMLGRAQKIQGTCYFQRVPHWHKLEPFTGDTTFSYYLICLFFSVNVGYIFVYI